MLIIVIAGAIVSAVVEPDPMLLAGAVIGIGCVIGIWSHAFNKPIEYILFWNVVFLALMIFTVVDIYLTSIGYITIEEGGGILIYTLLWLFSLPTYYLLFKKTFGASKNIRTI